MHIPRLEEDGGGWTDRSRQLLLAWGIYGFLRTTCRMFSVECGSAFRIPSITYLSVPPGLAGRRVLVGVCALSGQLRQGYVSSEGARCYSGARTDGCELINP